MRVVISSFLCLMGCALSAAGFGYEQCRPIASEINNMVAQIHGPAKIGIVIKSAETGRIYYERDAHHYFQPASVQKLFTVSSALINLGPDYRFATSLYATGAIRRNILQGDIVVQFSGDPSLTVYDLKQLVSKLHAMGITRITGNVIINDSAYNNIPYPAGWMWSDLTYDFAAPLNSIIINRNLFSFRIIPSRILGQKPQIIPDLPLGAARFYNEATTTRYNCPMSVTSNEYNQYVVHGCVPRFAHSVERSTPIRNMPVYAKSLVRQLLARDGISIGGFVLMGSTPMDAQLVNQHFSAPLNVLIVHLLKKSDNLYADTLLKKMGQYFSRSKGSWQNGVEAMFPVLENRAGINPRHIRLVDGAGLSRYNAISPSDISRLLSFIHHTPVLRKNIVPALPIAGVDGTLAFRMAPLARGERCHAKTGSMTGVSSLAGFIKTDHYGELLFVIMINDVPANRFPYIVLENNIAEYLAKAPYCG